MNGVEFVPDILGRILEREIKIITQSEDDLLHKGIKCAIVGESIIQVLEAYNSLIGLEYIVAEVGKKGKIELEDKGTLQKGEQFVQLFSIKS